VDQSLEKSHGGLGIGLTLVKRLVEMHEGTVEAFSEGPGRGSGPAPPDLTVAKSGRGRPSIEQPAVWKFCTCVVRHPGIPI
jgi:signal transduction histidine kinase